MNIFSLVLKQMRQRALSTTLTMMSVALGVALAVAIYMVSREGRNVFSQSDYGYELVVGPKGSATTLVMNSVYHVGDSAGNISYALYEDLASGKKESAYGGGKLNQFRGMVQWAVPLAVGDSYMRHPIVATTPVMFGLDNEGKRLEDEKKIPEYRVGKRFEFAAGRAFGASKFEAVIGSQTAKDTGLGIGSEFHATHGFPVEGKKDDVHDEIWKVVGILAPTHTANDRCLFIPLPTFYAIFEHEAGEETIAKIQERAGLAPVATTQAERVKQEGEVEEKAYTITPDGTVTPKLPKNEWQVSAVLVKTWSGTTQERVRKTLLALPDASAVNPAETMREFLDLFLNKVVLVLMIASGLVVVVAAVSILVSIYSAVTSRTREIAILRALGATRQRILAVTCMEAGVGGLVGALMGLVGGHLLGALGSIYLERQTGQGIPWWHVDGMEFKGVGAVVVMAVLAGLVPALKAYKVSVAENLAT